MRCGRGIAQNGSHFSRIISPPPRAQDGSTVNLVITEVGDNAVVADGNHPLAGEDLHFGLTLVEIKQAA